MRLGLWTIGLMAIVAGAAEAAPAEKRFSPQDIRADFVAMYQGLQEAHIDLYAFTPKPALDRIYAKTLAGLNRPMTRFEIQNRFEAFAANVHMGHTRVDSPDAAWKTFRDAGGKGFPLHIHVFENHVYVARNLSGLDAVTPGDEIVATDGVPMAAMLARVERHVSAETPYMAGSLMDYDFAIYLWVELGAVPGYDIALRKENGRIVKLQLPARSAVEMKAADATQPAMPDAPLRDAKIIAGNIAYLKPGPFYNAEAKTGAEEWEVAGFRKFIDDAFEKFDAARADRLIIDLRGNPGGDNLFSDVMIAWFADKPFRFFSAFKVRVSPQSTKANQDRIDHDAAAAGPVSQQYARMYAHAKPGDLVDFDLPLAQPRSGKRFKGKVFVLIDRQSYSNTVSVAALVQDYHFGAVLGEATSDMATTYGAMEQFALPHTGILVGYPKAHIVRPNGDQRSLGVTPDIAIPTPIVERKDDAVLQQAIAIAAK